MRQYRHPHAGCQAAARSTSPTRQRRASALPRPPPSCRADAAPPPPPPPPPHFTASQQQAVDAADNYLSDGQGFSKAGLAAQLDSAYGNGFTYADAVFAVNHVQVSWYQQAAISAKNYMSDGQGFSCSSLLSQLTSAYGGQFTQLAG